MFQTTEWKFEIRVIFWTLILLLEIILTNCEKCVTENNENVLEHRQLLFSNLDVTDESRKKKTKWLKYVVPMIFGAIVVKSIILPIVLKGLAVLSSKAVTLSIVSLMVATIFGVKRHSRSDKEEVIDIHVPIKYHGHKKYDDEEYEYYPHEHKRRNRKRKRRR